MVYLDLGVNFFELTFDRLTKDLLVLFVLLVFRAFFVRLVRALFVRAFFVRLVRALFVLLFVLIIHL